MKAVKTLNYVFIRNQNYYFRFNFPHKFLSADNRISLNTQNLVYALQRIEILAPLTNQLKALAMAAKYLSRPTLGQRIVWIK